MGDPEAQVKLRAALARINDKLLGRRSYELTN